MTRIMYVPPLTFGWTICEGRKALFAIYTMLEWIQLYLKTISIFSCVFYSCGKYYLMELIKLEMIPFTSHVYIEIFKNLSNLTIWASFLLIFMSVSVTRYVLRSFNSAVLGYVHGILYLFYFIMHKCSGSVSIAKA